MEDRGLDVVGRPSSQAPNQFPRQAKRLSSLGGPKRHLTLRSVTHLPLSFIGAGRQLAHWISADETSYQPLLQHFNNNASVRFPFSDTLHMMGGNQRPLFNIRGDWPEFNPPLSFSREPLTDWKLAASKCLVSLLVYPLNRVDGWTGSLTSYQDLQGRAALELDGVRSFFIS